MSPASPVATTPKVAVDRGVRVKELKCALCGGPFTDAHIENVNGQRCTALLSPYHSCKPRSSACLHLTLPYSFLLHTVRWAAQLDDDAASPRSPGDDSLLGTDGSGPAAQYAHSHCAQNIAQ
jgi:hypothetical protein